MNFSVLILAFLSASVAASACGASPDPALNLRLSQKEKVIEVHLSNSFDHAVETSSGFALAGKGGGNLIPVVVTALGQIIPPCAYMNPGQVFWETGQLAAKTEIAIWRGGIESLARLHCPSAGQYSLVVAYQARDGKLIFSNQLEITVEGNQGTAERRAVDHGVDG